MVAARLEEGRVDLATFEAPASPAVLRLAARIAWEPLADDRFPEAFEAEILCRLVDGTTRSVRVDDVFGNATRPAPAAAIQGKFRANAARSLPAGAVAALEAALDGLGQARDLAALQTALRPSPLPGGRSSA